MAQAPVTLTREQCAAIIDGMEAAIAAQGFDLYAGATRVKAWIDAAYPKIVAAQSRETLEAALQECTVEGGGCVCAAYRRSAWAYPD